MANRTLDAPDPLDDYDQRMRDQRAKQAKQAQQADPETLYHGKGERLPSGPLIRDAKGDPVGDVDQQGQAGYQAGEQTEAGEPFRKAGQWAKGQDKTTWRDKDERGPPDE